jgi:hypothetical protein
MAWEVETRKKRERRNMLEIPIKGRIVNENGREDGLDGKRICMGSCNTYIIKRSLRRQRQVEDLKVTSQRFKRIIHAQGNNQNQTRKQRSMNETKLIRKASSSIYARACSLSTPCGLEKPAHQSAEWTAGAGTSLCQR